MLLTQKQIFSLRIRQFDQGTLFGNAVAFFHLYRIHDSGDGGDIPGIVDIQAAAAQSSAILQRNFNGFTDGISIVHNGDNTSSLLGRCHHTGCFGAVGQHHGHFTAHFQL